MTQPTTRTRRVNSKTRAPKYPTPVATVAPATPAAPAKPSGSFRWIFFPVGPNDTGLLRITAQTKRGPVSRLYLFERIEGGIRLTLESGEHYDLDTFDVHWTCTCPDYQFRCGEGEGCKHVHGARAALVYLHQHRAKAAKSAPAARHP